MNPAPSCLSAFATIEERNAIVKFAVKSSAYRMSFIRIQIRIIWKEEASKLLDREDDWARGLGPKLAPVENAMIDIIQEMEKSW